jgi:hypothetical protein
MTTTNRLYNLLPELYRWRDESQGHTLQAFLSVIDQELGALEADMEAMYDNWFIQTCDDWVVPYLAGLLGVRNVAQNERMPFTQRRRVANTLAYRRRKGTIAVLEQIAWDVTNWHVSACEGHQVVAITRHNHRPGAAQRGLIDLRRDTISGVDDPLSSVLHAVDVRIPRLEGAENPGAAAAELPRPLPAHYGMENVTLSFWRLRSYPMRRSPACAVDQTADGGLIYTFAPDGRDRPLFSVPQSFRSITQCAERINLPAALHRRILDADLRAYRAAHLVDGRPVSTHPPANSDYYGPDRSFNIVVKAAAGHDIALAPWQLSVGNLSRAGVAPTAPGAGELHAVVDPETGRLALFGAASTYAGDAPHVLVDYAYGFSGDIGGGAYPRRYSPRQEVGPLCTIVVVAGGAPSGEAGNLAGGVLTAGSLTAALELWTTYCETLPGDGTVKPRGMIRILDNGLYSLGGTSQDDGTVDAIWLPDGGELAIVADSGVQPTLGQVLRSEDGKSTVRVVFTNPRHVPVLAAAAPALIPPEVVPERVVDRALYLGGLRLMGPLVFGDGDAPINTLDVRCEDCTLLGGITALDSFVARAMGLALVRCISGPLHMAGELAGLAIADSIVDAALTPGMALDGHALLCEDTSVPGARPEIAIDRSTILGMVKLTVVVRLDTVLFADRVVVTYPCAGEVRFCYLPAGSQVPAAQACLYEGAVPAGSEHCTGQVRRPVFTARRYGRPGYAQLAAQTPALFHTVTGDGGEIGVFHELYQAQRLANLNDVLERYLPLGFNAGINFVT